jgi:hypothetical protein
VMAAMTRISTTTVGICLSIYDDIPFSARAVALSRRLERVQMQESLSRIPAVFGPRGLEAKPTRRARVLL